MVSNYVFYLLTAIILKICNGDIDMTEPCRYAVAVGIEKEYIPDNNMWATTVTNEARSAKYGRVNGYRGGGAWTAGEPNKMQFLGIDLGYRHVITMVGTQGRRGSDEYITEFYMQYSSNNRTWSDYTNQFGMPYAFDGNTDDDTIKYNKLEYPLVARYIRFNPQRWHKFLSMRVEAYGCRFDGEAATFDGKSRITYDISGQTQYVQTKSDRLKIRFRTNSADGLLFFADGNQGDYIILELVRGRLYFHIDLGSTATQSGVTTMRAGSLLDDNQWHDIEINRLNREVNFTVDRLTMRNITSGEFLQLDLDRAIILGGIDSFLQPGKVMMSRKNFTGCMENVWFNYMNIIKDMRLKQARFKMHGGVGLGMCLINQVVPFTFPTVDAFLKMSAGASDNKLRMQISFSFRTYNKDGLLFATKFDSNGHAMMRINEQGFLEYEIKTDADKEGTSLFSVVANIDSLATYRHFTDGLWHEVVMDVVSATNDGQLGSVNVTIDGRSDASERQLSFNTHTIYYIGGMDSSDQAESLNLGLTGFMGCIRNLRIQGVLIEEIPYGSNFGVINGSCSLQDRCDPNPCEHNGICTQSFETFFCDCSATGYEGAVCHRSKYLVSCEEVRLLHPTLNSIDTQIDIDGSGPLAPLSVTCVLEHSRNIARTIVYHDMPGERTIDGFDPPGSYMQRINYADKDDPTKFPVAREVFDELVERSFMCEQNIKWRCKMARLLSDTGSSDPNIPSFGWWIGRTNLNMNYWGGASPGSGKCACGIENNCRNGNSKCNCDEGVDVWENDEGYISQKEHLPVMEVRFGDTGTINDNKEGKFSLGPLRCEGDLIFENGVTFRKRDATVEFDTFESTTSSDIRFQFRTTAYDGILIHNTGTHHFIEIRLFFGNSIHFRFDIGNGIQTLEKYTAYPLNDNKWHTVHVERNRRQAVLRIDLQELTTLEEPTDRGFEALQLDSKFVVGAAVDYRDGFVGCIRALMVNGKLLDLKGKVERGEFTYGVSVGCQPKCDSNPCMNEGVCNEFYSHYWCDCAYTPYRGWACGREVGVNLQPDGYIRYALNRDIGTISTDEEHIIIGFSTQEKKGTLFRIENSKTESEFISVEINNNGGVKVALDVGFGYSDQVNLDIPDVDLTNGQQHVVDVKRSNRGRKLTLTIDDYEPKIKEWKELPDDADTRLDAPDFIWFGRKGGSQTITGLQGCIFRAQFDNIFPLKTVFRDPRPDWITIYPENSVREDMCGFEEVTHPPDAAEYRPTPTINYNATTQQIRIVGDEQMELSAKDKGILGGVLGGVLLIIVIILIIYFCYLCSQGGAYRTNEAKGAEKFQSADYALAETDTGQPEIPRKQEYFL